MRSCVAVNGSGAECTNRKWVLSSEFRLEAPSVSASAGKGAIVRAAENTSPAVLYAYNALALVEIYDTNQADNGRDHFGNGNKYITR